MRYIDIDETTQRDIPLGKTTLDLVIYNGKEFVILGECNRNSYYYNTTLGSLNLEDLVTVANCKIINDYIPDSKFELHQYLSEYLKDENEFLVFVDLLQLVFKDIKSVVDSFTNLTDVDNVPEIFLPKLSNLINYTYNYDLPDDINRDIIKRLVYMYKRKSTDETIINSANYADNPKWIKDNFFLPEADFNRINHVTLEYPVENLFTHDVSTYSGTHRFQDSTRFRDGVLIIRGNNITQTTRSEIAKVVPAGIKVLFELTTESSGDPSNPDKDYVVFGEWVIWEDTELDYLLRIRDPQESGEFSGSNYPYKHLFSSKQIMFNDYQTEINRVGSYGLLSLEDDIKTPPLDNLEKSIDPIWFTKNYRGLPTRSGTAGFSSKYSLSGLSNQLWIESYDTKVLPTDDYYPVESVLNLKPKLDNYDTRYLGNPNSPILHPEIDEDNKLYYLDGYCCPITVGKFTDPKRVHLSELSYNSNIYNGFELRKLGSLKPDDTYGVDGRIGDLTINDIVISYHEIKKVQLMNVPPNSMIFDGTNYIPFDTCTSNTKYYNTTLGEVPISSMVSILD